MTQARQHPSLPLHLVPQQVADTEDWIKADKLDSSTLDLIVSAPSLHLVPGQPGTLSVQIESRARHHRLAWYVAITGNFPADWLSEKAGIAPSAGVPDAADFLRVNSSSAPERHHSEAESFPEDRPAQYTAIRHGDRAEKTFYFHVPQDYFEQQTAINQRQHRLPLNYVAEISLYAAILEPGPPQIVLAGFRPLQLQVRPSSTYTTFLPAIFQSSEVVSRFLALIEQAFDPTVQTADSLWAYLDPLTAPEALLPFLAHWVAWPLDRRWSIPQQRRLLRHAVQLYRWRGTRYGLRLFLHIYTGLPLEDDTIPEAQKRISVVENYQTGFVMGRVEFAQMPMLGGGRPFHFSVTLRPAPPQSLDFALLKDIVEQVKPAYCTYDLNVEYNEA
ncbi:phage tail protein [Nodosilinea sp. LEGE 07088]|uniref:phage tail protein n=1 Tax=Nodosilinea sp. LEGE 07088 TaxID=2777968 RepID=UPI00187F8085|nr:phage tail protein [Nodosilinea sp. LEGE 07088]MBE9138584.1 phage tail protein [Nodosilinea sp. LEGE 07088]